jgi:hypothetical protein
LHSATYSEASGIYVNELLKRDEVLASSMSINDSDIMNIYRIFRERLELYDRAGTMPLIEDDRKFLEYRRNEICYELREFKFMNDRKDII